MTDTNMTDINPDAREQFVAVPVEMPAEQVPGAAVKFAETEFGGSWEFSDFKLNDAGDHRICRMVRGVDPAVLLATNLAILHACGFELAPHADGSNRHYGHEKRWARPEGRSTILASITRSLPDEASPCPWSLTMYEDLYTQGSDQISMYSQNPARLDAVADRMAEFWGANIEAPL